MPHGSTLLPGDLTEDELVGAPVLQSADVLVIKDLTNDDANDLWIAANAIHVALRS